MSPVGWAGAEVYLNGSSLATSQTIKQGSPNHVLIVGSTGTTKDLYFNVNYTGSAYSDYLSNTYSSFAQVATWDSALSSDQITDLLASRLGIINASPAISVDRVTVAENTLPRVNVVPWQEVSDM
jgi:hypothetical protein